MFNIIIFPVRRAFSVDDYPRDPIDLGHFNSVRNSALRSYPTDQRDLSLLLAVLFAFVFCLMAWAVETGPVRAEHAYQIDRRV